MGELWLQLYTSVSHRFPVVWGVNPGSYGIGRDLNQKNP